MNIVQIGTNKAYDNMSDIVHRYSNLNITCLVMIEPFIYHNDSIKKCYSEYLNKLFIENIIITPDQEHKDKESIWYHELDATHGNAYELASLNRQHSLNIRSYYDINGMTTLELNCLTLNELFQKYNLETIDILYIDTEGSDDKIIYSIDFNKFIIKEIFYENLHIDKEKLRDFLILKNYSIEESTENDPYADRTILKS